MCIRDRLWQHNANLSYKLASIPWYDDIVRTDCWAGSARCWPLTGRWRGCSQNYVLYIESGRGWLAGDWPSTGGIHNITTAAWTACFLWWHSGNKKRTQNVSEYMLVFALCLVYLVSTAFKKHQHVHYLQRHAMLFAIRTWAAALKGHLAAEHGSNSLALALRIYFF